MSTKYSDITLERYILGELPSSEYTMIKEAAKTDSTLKERIDLLIASNEKILSDYKPEFIASRIRGSIPPSVRAGSRHRLTVMKIIIPSAAAMAALTALFVFLPETVRQIETTQPAAVPQTEIIRFKGDDAKLYLYKKTTEGSEQIQSGSAAYEGEIIQIAYASSKKYGIIFSIDGRGTVTRHLPSDGSAAAELQSGGTHYLKTSYQLDDAPSFERFFIIASDSQFDSDSILLKAHRAAKEAQSVQTCSFAADGFSEQSFIIMKRAGQ